MLDSNADDSDAIGIRSWVASADTIEGRLSPPNDADLSLRTWRSNGARRVACTAGVDVLASAVSTYTESMLTPSSSGQETFGRCSTYFLDDFNSLSLPAARLQIKRRGSPCYSALLLFLSFIFGSPQQLMTTPWCDGAGEGHNAAYRNYPTDSDQSPGPRTTWLSDPSDRKSVV